VLGVVAGPLHAVTRADRRPPLGLYCPVSLADRLDADELLALTRAAVSFYEDRFGCAFPFAKYDQCFVPGKAGAMENAACVTLSDQFLGGSGMSASDHAYRTVTMLHELSHMWFGDLVTMRWWDDLWLNEAFASWAATWAASALAPTLRPELLFSAQQKLAAYGADQRPTSHPVQAAVPDTGTVSCAFDEISYHKGASVLRQLVARLGEDVFLRALRSYFAKWAWSNAELRRFVDEVSAAADTDLTSWAQAWLRSRGMNELRLCTRSAGGRYTAAWVEQLVAAGDPLLREHRLALGVLDQDGGGRLRQRRSLKVTVTGPRTSLAELVGQPTAALLLLNEEDFAYAKIRLDGPSLRAAVSRCQDLPLGSQRNLCLSIAWDMVRDGELRPADLAGMVARTALVEERPSLLLAWARHAVTGLGHYDPDNCLEHMAVLAGSSPSGRPWTCTPRSARSTFSRRTPRAPSWRCSRGWARSWQPACWGCRSRPASSSSTRIRRACRRWTRCCAAGACFPSRTRTCISGAHASTCWPARSSAPCGPAGWDGTGWRRRR